jgi:hypothetical protein
MSEYEALEAEFATAVEAHRAHRAPWRLDPDGIWRCPGCEPVVPGPWVQLIPHVPRNRVARSYWWAARAIVAWWERTVDAARGWGRR